MGSPVRYCDILERVGKRGWGGGAGAGSLSFTEGPRHIRRWYRRVCVYVGEWKEGKERTKGRAHKKIRPRVCVCVCVYVYVYKYIHIFLYIFVDSLYVCTKVNA